MKTTMYTDEVRGLVKEAFTLEDRSVIEKMLEDRVPVRDITAAVDVDTHAKERALQAMADAFAVRFDPEGSKARREMLEREAKGEDVIQTPEDEAQWQAKIDAEASGTELPPSEMTREQLAMALKAAGVPFAANAKKNDLKKLYEGLKA